MPVLYKTAFYYFCAKNYYPVIAFTSYGTSALQADPDHPRYPLPTPTPAPSFRPPHSPTNLLWKLISFKMEFPII